MHTKFVVVQCMRQLVDIQKMHFLNLGRAQAPSPDPTPKRVTNCQQL